MVMEVAQAEVRSRGRAMAEDQEAVDNCGSAKRMKVGNGELRLSSSKSVRITDDEGGDVITTFENYADSVEEDLRELSGDATSLITSGDVQASCCSSNGSITEKLKSADLEEIRTEGEATVKCKFEGRESTQTSEFKEESGELESSTTSKPSALIIDSLRTIPSAKTPPAAELEEFFAKAEENLHKTFKDKYNFDFVNGVPLQGRFEWVQLNP